MRSKINQMSDMSSKKSKGRQKVEMVKMPNESNLQVTFSKRRTGLFKKASELCTLCGADIAIIVFSPGKKVFSFGHPCVETIVDRSHNLKMCIIFHISVSVYFFSDGSKHSKNYNSHFLVQDVIRFILGSQR